MNGQKIVGMGLREEGVERGTRGEFNVEGNKRKSYKGREKWKTWVRK
jgi:hypothetical protein